MTPRKFVTILLAMVLLTIGIRIELGPRYANSQTEPFSAYLLALPQDTSTIQSTDFLFVQTAAGARKFPGTSIRSLIIDSLTVGFNAVSNGQLIVNSSVGATNTIQLCTSSGIQVLNPFTGQGICLPTTTGTAGQLLTSSGSPTVPMTWTNPGGGGGGGVTSFAGRTGAVVPVTGDYSFSNIAGVATAAQIPLPTATTIGGVEAVTAGANQCMIGINTSGVPQVGNCVTSVGMTVPTGLAVAGSPVTGAGTLAVSWSGTIPNSSIPTPTTSALGGVESAIGGTGQFVTGINASGILQFATPAGGGNVSTSGTIVPGQCPTWATATTLNSVVCSAGSGTPLGYITVASNGAVGDGACHPLSGIYASLALAQAVYPFVSDLTQCVDWAATQKSFNQAFAIAGANDVAPVYCSLGNYQLSNPVFIDQANNTQGTDAAWAVGTTYGNNATVKYNGIRWQSMGSGNLGNAPTASNNFPSKLTLDTNDTFPIKVVTITNATPAVFTLARGAASLNNNQPIVLMPQSYAVPGGATPVLPAGLNAQQVYYVKTIVGNTFQVSATAGGASINTTSAGVGVFFANAQVWQVAPVSVSSSFGARVSFLGSPGLAGNTGCQYTATAMWMTAGFYIGPQNGVVINSVSSNHANGGGSTPPYRCNRWHGLGQGQNSNYSFFANHVGWQQMTNGGGSSQTKYENVGAFGWFTDFAVGYSSGQLGDSNTFIKSKFSDACIGVEWMETQAFINSMYDSTVFFVTTGLKSEASEGVRVIGGNYSGVQGLAASFAISAVSISGSVVTATVAAPDQYLQSAMCAMNAGYALNAVGPDYTNSTPLGNSCGYNVFTIVTPNFGVIPFFVSSFNPNTNVITLNMAPAYQNIYLGSLGVPAQVTSATKMYAAEMADVFFGQVQAENLHIENPLMPTTLMCNCGGFGAARAGELKSVLLNSALSRGPSVCCNQPSIPDSLLAQFYAQQTTPAIIAWQGDVVLDQLSSGSDFPFSPNLGDRALLASNTNVWLEGRHSQVGGPVNGTNTGAAPSFDFQADTQNAYTNVEGFTNTTLSGGYFWNNDQTFGGGTWDTPGFFLPASQNSKDIAVNNRVYQDMPSFWRTQGYGLHRNIGLRPDPAVQACILPAQANTLAGALPAITHQSNLIFQSFLTVTAGGTGYAVNDTITLAGGTFSTAAVGQVTSVTAGAVTGFTINQVLGVYSVQPPATFTQSATSGGGTGATFSALGPIWYVNYTIGYPMLWGGQLYRMCDYKGPTTGSVGVVSGKYTIQSNNIGYSYFQNLTTTNVPNLSWTMSPQSPFVYMNTEALELMFPGLNITLTPDNTNGCSNVAESFQVLEVHPTLGYIKVVNSGSNTGPQLPQFPGAGPCKNTTIGQQAVNLVAPY